jgi:hypothetical protein
VFSAFNAVGDFVSSAHNYKVKDLTENKSEAKSNKMEGGKGRESDGEEQSKTMDEVTKCKIICSTSN